MSKIIIYNDGHKDAQVAVLNHITRKPPEYHPLPAAESDAEPTVIDLGNGDIIIISLADSHE